jgi:uncharacterized protein
MNQFKPSKPIILAGLEAIAPSRLPMRKITSVEHLEAVVGKPSQMILMKAVSTLDDGCRKVLTDAPIAAFGFRDSEGRPHTTLVGGVRGFTRMDSAVQISFDLAADQYSPAKNGAVSLVFLLPGIGETLRVNGVVTVQTNSSISIRVQEAFVHCARCVLRSSLWGEVKTLPSIDNEARGLLSDSSIAGFLAASSFIAVSSWDASGAGDTSPKGDPPGFMRILDSQTLAIPDRKGNRRADTFHNVLTSDLISLVALVPGRNDMLQIIGTAYITDDAALLSTMAVGEKAPTTALIVRVERAELRASQAIQRSKLWDQAAQFDPDQTTDLNILATEHMSNAKTQRGTMAWLMRLLAKGLSRLSPKFFRKIMRSAYRKELKEEGY